VVEYVGGGREVDLLTPPWAVHSMIHDATGSHALCYHRRYETKTPETRHLRLDSSEFSASRHPFHFHFHLHLRHDRPTGRRGAVERCRSLVEPFVPN